MWNRAIRKDANSIFVSDFIESRVPDCSVICVAAEIVTFKMYVEFFVGKM
jgi:hypothetical protein